MNSFKRPTMLMILDGYGLNSCPHGNSIEAANKPAIDQIFQEYPTTQLSACGLAVGLPDGQMGNSEVGHLNIGAGRIVYQDFTRITKEIQEGSFFQNYALNAAINHVKSRNSALHLLGLVSDGGVHSHLSHLYALIDLAAQKGIQSLYVHCFLDGRDVPPRSALSYLDGLEKHLTQVGIGKIAMISGRYYAMDRDKRWERVEQAYDALTLGTAQIAETAQQAVEDAYGRGENDEFVSPTCVRKSDENPYVIADGDGVIFFNFRPDRARELTRALVADEFDGFNRKKRLVDLSFVCMTQYDAEMPNVLTAFAPQSLKNTLGEYIATLGLTQLRIAETEKYAHVTFFFNGGIEAPSQNEDRILIPSPKVATYDLQPEMSAFLVTDKVIEMIQTQKYDLIILNFANADMVGHTGIMEAAQKAIEALDACIPRIVTAVLAQEGQILLTADHGNADYMLDKEENVVTAHSINPVPLVHIAHPPRKLRDGGILADLAPTLLELMGIPIPPEMTGQSLLLPEDAEQSMQDHR